MKKNRHITKVINTLILNFILILSSANTTAYANQEEMFEYGKYLSSQCVTCHQISTKNTSIPSIAGWDQESFFAVMDSYRNKERENKVMQTIASSLVDDEIKALALYFSKQGKEE